MPGHGLSDRPDAPYTLDWYAAMMHGWLDAIGVGTTSLIGHSYGGGVAQWMVLARRSRIERVALVAPGGLGRSVNFGLRVALFPVLGRLLTQPLMHAGTHVLMRIGIGGPVRLEPEEIALSAARNRAPGTGRAFHRTVAGCMDLAGQRVQTWERIHEVDSLPLLALFWESAIASSRSGMRTPRRSASAARSSPRTRAPVTSCTSRRASRSRKTSSASSLRRTRSRRTSSTRSCSLAGVPPALRVDAPARGDACEPLLG